MKSARNVVVAGLALVLVFCSAGWGQVLKQVPANAMLVLKVADLEATSKKLADFLGVMGVVQMQPMLADPLGSYLTMLGVHQGINKSGEMAVAMLDPDDFGGNIEQSFIMLLPVSDYQSFLGNYPDAKTEGDVSQIQFPAQFNSEPMFVAHWGDYAVISQSKEYLGKKPETTLEVTGLAVKELDSKDFVLLANFTAIRPKLLPQIEKGRALLNGLIDKAAATPNAKIGNYDMAKLAPVLKAAMSRILDMGQAIVQDSNTATVSANLSPEGIGVTMMAEFLPDTYLGKHVAQIKNTDASMLTGLPEGKYLFFGGSVADPQQTSQVLSDLLAPVETAVTAAGPDLAPVNDVIGLIKRAAAAQTGGAYGLVAPHGQLRQDPLLEMVSIKTGDAKVLQDVTHKLADTQQSMMKTLGAAGTPQSVMTFTPAAKSVDGVSLDEMQITFNMNGQSFQEMQAAQFLSFLYGANGAQVYTGLVTDHAMLTVSGVSDDTITAAIEAIKKGDDPLAKVDTVKTVAAQLPPQRFAAFYIPLDQWATTGLNVVKQFNMDMGVKIPDDLPPVGGTISTDGTAVRLDSYIPTQLVQALTAAGIQMFMSQHTAGPGGGL
jgi:hypothetical protein